MAAFLIETAKALLTFIAVCVGLGVLYLVFVVVREVGWIVKQENRRKYEQEGKRMETAVFKAVCPLEIGDTVAIGAGKTAAGVRTAYYLPAGMEVVVAGTVSIHTVTDISTTHYLKSGKTVFRYELNGSGRYEVLNVKVPVRETADELNRRGR